MFVFSPQIQKYLDTLLQQHVFTSIANVSSGWNLPQTLTTKEN